MIELLRSFVIDHITSFGGTLYGAKWVLVGVTVLMCVLAYYIAKVSLYFVERLVVRSPGHWDDDLLNERMLRAMAQLAPAIFVYNVLPIIFYGDMYLPSWIMVGTEFYILWAVVHIFTIFINNLYHALAKRKSTQDYAVKGIFQMMRLVAVCVGVIIGLSILLGREPTAILTTIGASAAVLMLVFKDTILGLVASVQLTANKMLKRGDWIEVEKLNVNGEVIDVSLTTVKVRNWDNTISTIPPYTLVSDAFRNYEGMRESGGRRVYRSIYIDVNSIRFCSAEEINKLADAGMLEGVEVDKAGKMVNIQLLRSYIEAFLKQDARVNQSMLSMVRELDPTPHGLPLQMYFFTASTEWVTYEHSQSDIFDHIYAVVNMFGLRIFQSPAGADLQTFKG